MSTVIPRFYETNIKLSHSLLGSSNNQVEFENKFDSVPIPSPAPAPKTCPPAPACAPAPACKPCAPAPAPRVCPPAPACPACPTVTKLRVISAAAEGTREQRLIVEARDGAQFNSVSAFVRANPSTTESAGRSVSGGKRGDMKGGQAVSNYTFRPNIFGMSNSYNFYSDNIPVYFDYYVFYSLSPTNIINSRTTTSTSPEFINNNFINSLFVLDDDKMPHYLSAVVRANTFLYYAILKKRNYMSTYFPSTRPASESPNGLDPTKMLNVDIKLNNKVNTDIVISDITLMPIPTSINIPRQLYAKPNYTPAQNPRVAPIVERPVPPAPAPQPAPQPVPRPAPAPARG